MVRKKAAWSKSIGSISLALLFASTGYAVAGNWVLTPAGAATHIQAHLGAFGATAGQTDLNASDLLANIQNRVMSAAAAQEERDQAVIFSGIALTGALSSADKFSSLEAYLAAAKTDEMPELGKDTIALMEEWYSAVQKDPATRKKFAAMHKTLEQEVKALGAFDEGRFKALWDGSMAGARPAIDLAVPVFVGEISAQTKGPQLTHPPVKAPLVVLTPEDEAKVRTYVDTILRIDPNDYHQREQATGWASSWGLKEQEKAAIQSKMLQKPLRQMAKRGDNGGEISKAMVELQMQTEALDPTKINWEPGWWRRAVGKIPFIGPPARKYVASLESAQTAIKGIVQTLDHGRKQLEDDNIDLHADQKRIRELSGRLAYAVEMARHVDAELEKRLDSADSGLTAEHANFLREEVLLEFRSRISDLQQQLAVNQQGTMAMDLIIKNNKVLMGSIERTKNTIPPVLQIGAIIAVGLDTQRTILKIVKKTNEAGAKVIERNAQLIKTQGVEIQKLASETTIPVETLKQAYAQLTAAFEDLAQWRTEALPKVTQSVEEFNALTIEGEKILRLMDRSIAGQSDPALLESKRDAKDSKKEPGLLDD